MKSVRIRDLDGSDWAVYRELRLAALQESPQAFVGTYSDEREHDEASWRDRIRRAHRFVAESEGAALGVVGLGDHGPDDEGAEAGEIFDLWVAPEARAVRVARALVATACKTASEEGRTHLYFWVVPENVPALAFATNIGFHPTSQRRPTTENGEDEVALVLTLLDDPTSIQNPVMPWLP